MGTVLLVIHSFPCPITYEPPCNTRTDELHFLSLQGDIKRTAEERTKLLVLLSKDALDVILQATVCVTHCVVIKPYTLSSYVLLLTCIRRASRQLIIYCHVNSQLCTGNLIMSPCMFIMLHLSSLFPLYSKADAMGVDEEQYFFLKRVCQVLVHLGTSQLAPLWVSICMDCHQSGLSQLAPLWVVSAWIATSLV